MNPSFSPELSDFLFLAKFIISKIRDIEKNTIIPVDELLLIFEEITDKGITSQVSRSIFQDYFQPYPLMK